jgi:hypothetical protein
VFDTKNGPRYAASPDEGKTFSAPIAIVDATKQPAGLVFSTWDVAVSGDGRVHVAMGTNAWKLKLPQDEWALQYAVLAPGASSFSPVRNLNHTASEGFALAANGRDVTATFLKGKLFAMTSRDHGETFTTAAQPDETWNPCDCCTTALTYGADGRLALLYREETNNERDIYLALCDPRGGARPVRTRVSTTGWKIAACPMTYFTITATATGYVAAWPTKGDIYFARLDRNGALLPPGEIKTPGHNGMRTGVVALPAADGATLIAWKEKDTLGWQLYDARGAAQGGPGSAKSAGNGAAGVVARDGTFLLFP